MKTYKNLFSKICSFENLYFSYLKARRGKNNKKEVLKFTYNLERNLFVLQKELLTEKYKTGKYRKFTIYEPKKREISALPFRDRIVHHSLYSVLEPIFEKYFISDSYACRKNKGTHKGIDKLQYFLIKEKPKYVLKCDVRKYFASVNHLILKKIISKRIKDKKTLSLIYEIIDSTKSEKGIPIGNLTSQLFANIYLNELDLFLKERQKIKFYLRYMDDFLILGNSKKQLWFLKNKINKFLLFKLKLELHYSKSLIFPSLKGIDFLGYVCFPFHKLARKSTISNFLRKIKIKIKKYYIRKSISFDKLIESFNSWEAYLNKAKTFNLKNRIYLREEFKNVY